MAVSAKICGLNSAEAVNAATSNGAAYAGFIFFPKSPRYITPKAAKSLGELVPPEVKKVAVVVDATDNELAEIISNLKPDFLQLHGSETLPRVAEIKNKFKLPVIKAVKIKSEEDIRSAHAFEHSSNMLLFDAKAPIQALPGGNGISFDWMLLEGQKFRKPWLLSGGLSLDNIESAVKITGAKIVDLSSSLEVAPGKKDPGLIKDFLKKIKEF